MAVVAAGRVRRLGWLAPEWPWVLAVCGAWLVLAQHAGHRHPLPLGGWVTMAVAMMLPASLPVVRAVAAGSTWPRRRRAPAVFAVSYLAVWTAVGAVAIAVWRVAGLQSLDAAAATAVLLAVAGAWLLTPWHVRCLKRCHRMRPLGFRGRAADRACARFGAWHGAQCAGACWPLMLVMLPGHGYAGLTVALWLVGGGERIAQRPRPRVAAAVVLALAAGFGLGAASAP